MNLDEMRANAYMKAAGNNNQKDEPLKKSDLKGFQKFSDAIPENPYSGSQKTKHPLTSSTDERPILYKATGPADGKDSVYRRVAKFLVIIGDNEAAKILPHLTEEQILKIVPEIASIRSVSPEEKTVILEEFNGLFKQAREEGGVATAREILEKAYGKKRADELLEKAMPQGTGKPFEYLNDADTERVYLLLRDESEAVQSLVLSHLEAKKAAEIINMMNPDEKRKVVLRLAKMEPISPEVIRRVDKSMHEKAINFTAEKAENIDGRNALAQILKKMDPHSEKEILTNLSVEDPNLGEDLRSRLFTIDDVIHSDDKYIQRILREMANAEIVYLIAGKTDEFREKILCNVSINKRSEILSDEEILKPFRKTDCDRVTNEFFLKLRRAFESGTLFIKGRNEDQYV